MAGQRDLDLSSLYKEKGVDNSNEINNNENDDNLQQLILNRISALLLDIKSIIYSSKIIPLNNNENVTQFNQKLLYDKIMSSENLDELINSNIFKTGIIYLIEQKKKTRDYNIKIPIYDILSQKIYQQSTNDKNFESFYK